MDAQNFKNALITLEEQLKSEPSETLSNPHTARNLYFELQRLVHQYESVQVGANSDTLS